MKAKIFFIKEVFTIGRLNMIQESKKVGIEKRSKDRSRTGLRKLPFALVRSRSSCSCFENRHSFISGVHLRTSLALFFVCTPYLIGHCECEYQSVHHSGRLLFGLPTRSSLDVFGKKKILRNHVHCLYCFEINE